MSKVDLSDYESLINNSTFCVAPFTSLYVDPEDKMRVCCIAGTDIGTYDKDKSLLELYNTDSIKNVRSDLINGIKNKTCTYCYNNEQVGIVSLRQRLNPLYKKWWLEYINNVNDDFSVENLNIKYLDVRFSNKCNLKCRTCSVGFSSSWYSDTMQKHPHWNIVKKRDSTMTVEALKPTLLEVDRIYFAGGEPLITDQHYEILEFLLENNKNNVKLAYNTNFSKLIYKNKDVLDYWEKFENVHIGASLDGNHERGEYIRKNLRWDDVIKNIERLRERNKTKNNISFNLSVTVSIFNAYNLVDQHREWVEKEYITPRNLTVNICYGPWEYNLKNLPDNHKNNLRKLYADQIKWLQQFNYTNEVVGNYQALLNLLDQPAQENWREAFLKEVKFYDRLRNENFFTVFPEYSDLENV